MIKNIIFCIRLHMELYGVEKLQINEEKAVCNKAGVLMLVSRGNRFCMLLIVVPCLW